MGPCHRAIILASPLPVSFSFSFSLLLSVLVSLTILALSTNFSTALSFQHNIIPKQNKKLPGEIRYHQDRLEHFTFTRLNRNNYARHKTHRSSLSGENDVSMKANDGSATYMDLELKSSISSIPEDSWNRCLSQDTSSPFMEHS